MNDDYGYSDLISEQDALDELRNKGVVMKTTQSSEWGMTDTFFYIDGYDLMLYSSNSIRVLATRLKYPEFH